MHGPQHRRGAPDRRAIDDPLITPEDVVKWFAAARCTVDAANPEVHALAGEVNWMRQVGELPSLRGLLDFEKGVASACLTFPAGRRELTD
jgi:hypothetical protein